MCYLSDISPKDARKDYYKACSEATANTYQGTELNTYSVRIHQCAESLGFGLELNLETGESKFLLNSARFCRCRHCTFCQSRRVLMWGIRFKKSLPKLLLENPRVEFIFLTLTVKTCPVERLRETLDLMNKAWQRLIQRKQFPGLGFVKTVEVTRSKASGEAHPHFHCLIAVDKNYFSGRKYLNTEDWAKLFQSCMKLSYEPITDVRKVKPKKGIDDPMQALIAGLTETVKYTVKPEDLTDDKEWLVELTKQLHKTRAIAIGGIFKKYLSEEEPEDLISESLSEENEEATKTILVFDYSRKKSKYLKRD